MTMTGTGIALSPGPEWQRLCAAEDMAAGTARGFDPFAAGQTTVFVVRSAAGFFAYRDLCPHFGTTQLAWKRDAYLTADGNAIECSLHGARFSIEDGVCSIGPCLGDALTPVRIVEANGVVWIHRAEERREPA